MKGPRFVVVRGKNARGADLYQGRDVGSVTHLRGSAWSSASREAAERLAAEVGGTVAPR